MTASLVTAGVLLPVAWALTCERAAGEQRPAVVVTITATDDMRFNPDVVKVQRGDRVVVRLRTVSDVPKIAMVHNFVLLKREADARAMVRLSNMTPPGDLSAQTFGDRVLAATAFAGGGETVQAEFIAPQRRGRYVFICTYLSHYQEGMKGVLIVE